MDNLDLDPELAALLEDIPDTPVKKTPSIKKESLFSSSAAAIGEGPSGPEDVDLTESSFTKIEKFFADKPHAIFSDPAYYKKVLGNENESANRLHGLLTKFLTCQDPKDRSVYRQQLITAYWDFMSNIALKTEAARSLKRSSTPSVSGCFFQRCSLMNTGFFSARLSKKTPPVRRCTILTNGSGPSARAK